MTSIFYSIKNDPEYHQVWKDNLEMSLKDTIHNYKIENGKKVLTDDDIEVVSKEFSEYFIYMLYK